MKNKVYVKYYCGDMLHTLDFLAGAYSLSGNPTSVVAVADDTAPSSRGVHPRQAISDMQVLLYATEDEGKPVSYTHLTLPTKRIV